MRRARLVEASVCTEREGGGGGGTRGETGARKEGGKGACQLCRRRVTNRPTACYHPASPGILSLSFYLSISLSLSLSSIQSIGSQPCLSVPRELPPHSASRESSSDQPRCLSTSLRCFNSKVCRSSKTASSTKSDRLFFSFDIIKAAASRNVSRDTFLPFDNITFHVPAREKVRLVPRASLFPERI